MKDMKKAEREILRVLVVTNMYPSAERPGFGIFVKRQVDALSSLPGVEVTLWPFQGGGLRYISAFLRLHKFARGRHFDAVHAHYGLSGWVALAVRKAPILVTFHGTDLRHPLVGPLSRLLARMVGQVAVASPLLKERLGRRAGGAAVLPTGVDLNLFKPTGVEEARAQLGLDPDGSYILFPADPSRKVKRYELARQLAERLGRAELLKMDGRPPREVPLWINASNAVIVTSAEEGFALAVCESLACDKPVLSTPVGIAPLALEGIDGCLCAGFDLERWSEEMAPHLEVKDPRVRGRQRAIMFECGRMAERVRAVLATIAADG